MLPLLYILFSIFGSVIACPPAEDILPCHCKAFTLTTFLICKGIMNPDEFESPFHGARKYNIEFLSIEDSSLLYLPSSVFKNTKFQDIRLLDSELMSFSDTDVAFEGLEDILKELRATGVSFTAQWDWQQLRNLNQLEVIDVNWVSMDSVSEVFPELPNLKYLGLSHADISYIIPFAFHALKNLETLNMDGNYISELERNILPDPASKLEAIDFSDNNLSTLPEDFFSNMLGLTYVKLDKNKFMTLPEEVFSWPLDIVEEFTVTDNPLRCDCRIRWIVDKRLPQTFTGYCASPEFLAGRHLGNLTFKELWC